jgi:hypothetical protein
MELGDTFKAEIVLNVNELSGEDVGVEVLFGKKENDEVRSPMFIRELEMIKSERNIVSFSCEIPINQAGVYDFAFRLFPKNPLLPHRQDFNLVKWL